LTVIGFRMPGTPDALPGHPSRVEIIIEWTTEQAAKKLEGDVKAAAAKAREERTKR
jgi:hypothetical protein